jgi:hypothetical protein
VTGISVQIGPRAVGERCRAWGLVIARDSSLVATAALGVLVGMTFAVAFTVAVMAAHGRFSQPAPVDVPRAFCPAGQHMTGTAGGWPVCIPDH